jgi:hypothetical protein
MIKYQPTIGVLSMVDMTVDLAVAVEESFK